MGARAGSSSLDGGRHTHARRRRAACCPPPPPTPPPRYRYELHYTTMHTEFKELYEQMLTEFIEKQARDERARSRARAGE